MPALSNATRASTNAGRTPLVGRSSTLARSSIGGPHGVYPQGRSDAGCVTPDEIDLKLIELAGRHSHIGELSEAGVDAVDGFARRHCLINQTAASLEAGQRVAAQHDARFGRARDLDHIVDREVLATERYCGGRHGNKSKRYTGYREQGP